MRKILALLILATLAVAGCGGDDDDAATSDGAGDAGDSSDSGDTGGDDSSTDGGDTGTGDTDGDDSSTDGGDTGGDDASGDDGSSGGDDSTADDGGSADDGQGDSGADDGAGDDGGSGDGLFPGPDVDICALFEPEELQPFVDFPIEEGDPFFSGSSLNSCDWVSPVDAEFDDIGSISIRLVDASTYVVIDEDAYSVDGLGESAEVEGRFGQTNVHFGDSVVTFQVVGMRSPTPDIASSYSDLAAPADALVTTEDIHASLALALAFTDRLSG